MATPAASVAGRAALAVGLMIGFYVLALAISAGLLFIPAAEVLWGRRVHVQLAVFCIVGAGSILWAIVPRPDRFEPPGPRLRPERHPELFRVLREIADSTRQEMPSEVYAVPDLNAWVANRGGVMGFGSRRVMGLGLPLMAVLTVSEFRAVLAHEFGHYFGGDTRLGPWIYKTRAAIGRTLAQLSKSSQVLQKPFQWYGALFLRITHAVSRRQEFTADALAATTVGARPLAAGLKKLRACAPAFEPYWNTEVQPILQAGHIPPIAEGFVLFTKTPRITRALEKELEEALKGDVTNPYDTHPALPARLEALAALSPGPDPAGEAPALSWLDRAEISELERGFLATTDPARSVSQLKTVRWEDSAVEALLPAWSSAIARQRDALAGVTIASLVEHAPRPGEIGARLRLEGGSAEDREQAARWFLGIGLSATLHREGWSIVSLPGEDVVLRSGDVEIRPFAVVSQLAAGDPARQGWAAECQRLGIGDLPLVRMDRGASP